VKRALPAPKAATDVEGFAVSLKRYPDTNRLVVFALVLMILLGARVQLWAQTQAASPQPWERIPIPKLPAFHPAQPKRFVLPNGMVIFLQEDHELPTIDGTARIRGGERSVPANKTGLTDIYGEVWRTGGTKTQTGDQLDDFLEQRAAKVETGGGGDSTTVSWSCLKDDFDDVFRVFDDVLRNPEFRAEKIEIAQKGLYDAISRRNDDPGQIAGREAAKLVYGANNPYARVPEYKTVAAVTRQDLVEWHGKYVHPNNIILGVVGDFDSAKMEAKLREAFASWPKGPAASNPEIKPDPAKAGYYEVDKTDINQSHIQMVALGITRKNPDYFATSVFNEAFGGGFSSRMFGDIRTTKGLAYAVGGGIGSGWDHPGMLRLMVSTKSVTTIESIQALDEEIADLNKRPINDEEIKRAKDAILNSFVFRFDSPDKVLQEKMAYEFYGYPLDFLENFQKGIEGVTKEDVARVAAKYLHRDQMAVLVVGNTKEFDKPLSSLGSVTKLDITIPAAPPGLMPEQGEQR
jgi:zinc protease